MILNIFSDFWNGLVKFSDNINNYIMDNYDKPFMWIIIFGVLLLIAYAGISKFADK